MKTSNRIHTKRVMKISRTVISPTTKPPPSRPKIVKTTKLMRNLIRTMTSSNVRPNPPTLLPRRTSQRTKVVLHRTQPCRNRYVSRPFTLAPRDPINKMTKITVISPTPTLTSTLRQRHALLYLRSIGTAEVPTLCLGLAPGSDVNPLKNVKMSASRCTRP